MSASDVYKATNTSDQVVSVDEDGKPIDPATQDKANNETSSTEHTERPVTITTATDKYVPIRTQSKVMRIWVDAWETKDNNLHSSQYIFTEIEKRKWQVGETYVSSRTSLTPLKRIASNIRVNPNKQNTMKSADDR